MKTINRIAWLLRILLSVFLLAGCSGGGGGSNGGASSGDAPGQGDSEQPIPQEEPQKPIPATGLYSLESQGVERVFYVQMPGDYSPMADSKPLLFAFHGLQGDHRDFLDNRGGFFGDGFAPAVGDGAIIVYPEALPNNNGLNQWDTDVDFQYFEDMLAMLDGILVYDKKRLFLTGHSAGGGMAHRVGCHYGDIVRAIAPSAGALLSQTCTGSVAVIQIHGKNDSVVPVSIVEPTHRFWVLYNGFDLDTFSAGVAGPCIDHSLGASLYPVQYCLHEEAGGGTSGHRWPTFAGEAIWEFFSSLPEAEPSIDPPPGGGNQRAEEESPATLSFSISFPPDIGKVYALTLGLYPAGVRQPIYRPPLWFLNTYFDPGEVIPGVEYAYQVPVNINWPDNLDLAFSAPTLSLTVYVEGGGFPIPVTGFDMVALQDIVVPEGTVSLFIDEPIELEAVIPSF